MKFGQPWTAIVIVLVIIIAALQVMTLEGQVPVLTTTVSTRSQTTTFTELTTSTLSQVVTLTTTTTMTTGSDIVTFAQQVAPWGVPDSARGFVYYGVSTNFSVSPAAPFLTNNTGYRYVNLFFIATLYNSTGYVLDSSNEVDQVPPGTSASLVLGWRIFQFYPGFPAGTYQVEVSPIICSVDAPGPPPSCQVVGRALYASFVIP